MKSQRIFENLKMFLLAIFIFSSAFLAMFGFISLIFFKESSLSNAIFTSVLVIITGIYAYSTHQSVKISQKFLFNEDMERKRRKIIEIAKGVIIPIKKNLLLTKQRINSGIYFKKNEADQLILSFEKTDKLFSGDVFVITSEINPRSTAFSSGFYCSAKHLLNYPDETLQKQLPNFKEYDKKYNNFIDSKSKSIPENFSIIFNDFRNYCKTLPLLFIESGTGYDFSDLDYFFIFNCAITQKKAIDTNYPIFRLYNNNFEKLIAWVHENQVISKYIENNGKEIENFVDFISEYEKFLNDILFDWEKTYDLAESEIQDHVEVPVEYRSRKEYR